MYDDGATAEVRRLQLMSRPPGTPQRHRKDRSPRWVVPTVFIVSTLILLAAGWYLYDMVEARTDNRRGSGTHQPATVSTALPTPVVKPTQSVNVVANAKKVKPLEDIEKGDRVLYQGSVCTWQEWDGNINTSVIRCAGETFEIQTGRLTPVELKAGPSKLQVRHS